MADNVTVGNVSGQANDYIVSTDQASSGQVQRVKLAFSADGSDTHVTADEQGLLVTLPATLRRSLEDIAAAVQLVAGTSGRILDRQTDSVGAALATSITTFGGRELLPQYAFANVAASTTDAPIVPALPGHRIIVLLFRLHSGATATNITFNSKGPGAGGAISEQFQIGANSGRADGFTSVGHFATAVGQGLTATTGSGSTMGVGVVYVYH